MNYGLHAPPVILHLCVGRSPRRGAPGQASSQQPLQLDIEAAVRSVQRADCRPPGLPVKRAPYSPEGELRFGESLQDGDGDQGLQHSRQSHTLQPQLLPGQAGVLDEGKLG